jgi:hypothetical protein
VGGLIGTLSIRNGTSLEVGKGSATTSCIIEPAKPQPSANMGFMIASRDCGLIYDVLITILTSKLPAPRRSSWTNWATCTTARLIVY